MSKVDHKLVVEPYTQWEPGVAAPSSACGPATMAALAEYWSSRMKLAYIPGKNRFDSKAAHINHMYSHHGGTPLGMSVRTFIKGIRAYIAAAFPVTDTERTCPAILVTTFNDMAMYQAEIDAKRPVAVKFDKWFKFRWRGSYAYDYHWVLGIGYEETPAGCFLIVHDNGVRYKDGSFTPGRERRIDYRANKDILTMVAVNIDETPVQ